MGAVENDELAHCFVRVGRWCLGAWWVGGALGLGVGRGAVRCIHSMMKGVDVEMNRQWVSRGVWGCGWRMGAVAK